MTEYISRWLAEEVDFSNEDKVYDDIAKDVIEKTSEFNNESGTLEYKDFSEGLIAKSILEERYPTVDLEEDGESIKVTYSNEENEELREATWSADMVSDEILPDKNPNHWVGNKGTTATGGAMAMGESYDYEEPVIACPDCGNIMVNLGGQGDFEEFTCDNCGTFWYLDDESNLYSAEEAWGDWNSLDESKIPKSYFKEYNVHFDPKRLSIMAQLSGELGLRCDVKVSSNRRGDYRVTIERITDDKSTAKDKIKKVLDKFKAKNIKINFKKPDRCEVSFRLVGPFIEAVEKHDELNPDLFENNELKPEVKEKLFQIVDNFKKNLEDDEIKLDIDDVVIVGSNASYNFTDKSDIDLHILADLSVYDGMEDLAQKLYNAYKTLWNNKFDPMIYGHEVEIYVEPSDTYEKEPEVETEIESLTESLILDEAISNGVYSLYNGWIKEPVKDDIPEPVDISAEVSEYTEKANQCQTIDEIDDFIDNIYILRQSSILQGGEYSEGNLIFKELRNNGILQELKDKKVELQNQEMSL